VPSNCSTKWSKKKIDGEDHDCYSTAPIPGLLHACYESRTKALKWYKLCFGAENEGGRTFFDFTSDHLMPGCEKCNEVQCDNCVGMGDAKDLIKVQNLLIAWDAKFAWPFCFFHNDFPVARKHFFLGPSSATFKEGVKITDFVESTESLDW